MQFLHDKHSLKPDKKGAILVPIKKVEDYRVERSRWSPKLAENQAKVQLSCTILPALSLLHSLIASITCTSFHANQLKILTSDGCAESNQTGQ